MTFFTKVHRELITTLASRPITSTVVMALRKQVDAGTANALLEIASLQPKAILKFGEGVWMVTSRALQQATDRIVANYKASLFQDRMVVDLCGGIGGDAMGFARRGPVVTVDLDPNVTRMAAENLRSIHAASAVAVCADVTTYFTSKQLAIEKLVLHIDPDRRPDDRRTTAPNRYSPSFDFVSMMVDASDAAIVKLAPAAQIDERYARRHHRQWISCGGSVREQTLLCGDCIEIAGLKRADCSATRVFRDGRRDVFSSSLSDADGPVAIAPQPLRYIVDLDPAVRAAGLSESFSIERELACLGDASGFLTTDQWIPNQALMQCFECVWTGPADVKQLRKAVRTLELAVDVVKVRGTDHDPVRLQGSLRAKVSGKPTTLLIGRSTVGIYAVLALPLNTAQNVPSS